MLVIVTLQINKCQGCFRRDVKSNNVGSFPTRLPMKSVLRRKILSRVACPYSSHVLRYRSLTRSGIFQRQPAVEDMLGECTGFTKQAHKKKKLPPKNKEYSVLLRTLVVQEKKYGTKLGNRPTCQWFTVRRTCKQFLAWRTCMSPLLDSILPTERHGICEGH